MLSGDNARVLEAVIFDLDGVLIDSERAWTAAREQLVRERGGRWRADATRTMMGMSAPEWSRYMRDALGVNMEPEQIAAEVVQGLEARYRRDGPPRPRRRWRPAGCWGSRRRPTAA